MMRVDLAKLERIEARAEVALAGMRATSDRCRARRLSADGKRQEATAKSNDRFRLMPLSELAAVPRQELHVGGVNLDALNAAMRDQRAARDLQAEHERQAAESRDLVALVHSLRTFAGRA